MKTLLIALLLFPMLVMGGEKEDAFLKEKMIPLAQDFIKRNVPSYDSQFGTNRVKKFKVDYFTDRPGCLATMRLADDFFISFHAEKDQVEINNFHHLGVTTSYELNDAPKEKKEAVKALNLKNKLNDKTALELAKRYFKLQGHKEENFHPPELLQSYWIGKEDEWGKLPYYEITWYRKDVKSSKEPGIITIPQVTMTVSGIDSSLVSYSKLFMPVGKDF